MKRKEIDVQAQVKALKGKSTQREKDAASSLLVQRFNESLFYFILKMVRNQEDAEDILQQVWAKAFNRRLLSRQISRSVQSKVTFTVPRRNWQHLQWIITCRSSINLNC
jgi:hypothetical protein